MIFVGIDPGHEGAIAILGPQGALEIHDMPVKSLTHKRWAKVKTEKGWSRRKKTMTDPIFDSQGFANLLGSLIGKSVLVTLEKIQLWGQNEKAGTNSLDTFLKEYGMLKAVLETFGFQYQEVPPTTWQNYLDKPEEKAGSMKLAKYLYPGAPIYGPKGGALDGRADALLIAHYGKEKFLSATK